MKKVLYASYMAGYVRARMCEKLQSLKNELSSSLDR